MIITECCMTCEYLVITGTNKLRCIIPQINRRWAISGFTSCLQYRTLTKDNFENYYKRKQLKSQKVGEHFSKYGEFPLDCNVKIVDLNLKVD